MRLQLEHASSSLYGAQMGRRSILPDSETKLYLQKMPFVDGDYDQWGAYWGSGGGSLYCAFSDKGAQEERIFIRAKSRDEAKKIILEEYEHLDLRFYR